MAIIIDLDVDLNPGERGLYEAFRRPDGANLPTYFSSDTNSDVEISREFESFLILTDRGLRSKMVSWLQGTSTRLQTNVGREELFVAMCDVELNASVDEIVEADSELQSFTEFRNELFAGKFATVPEVRTLLNDLQLGISAKTRTRDSAQHRNNAASIIAQINQLNDDSLGRQQQAQSWMGVLLAY